MQRKGFTLIELLVVIAIIAILAAILFPVFARAREKARQASCTSNLKQIALAMMMYVQDYDETLPAVCTMCWGSWSLAPSGTPSREDKISVVTRLMPYVKNGQVWECPSRTFHWCPDPGKSIPHHAIPQDEWDGFLTTNVALGYGFVEDMLVNGRAVTEYKEPSMQVICGDATGYLNERRLACSGPYMVCQIPGGCGGMPDNMKDEYTRHSGGSNVAFLDGHVKWEKWENILSFNGIKLYPWQ